MTQKYEPVEWTDETPTQPGTLINKARMDQMQSAHHFADGFEEVDAIPAEDPGTDYHKVVYCTADSTFYRWDGTQWTADIDDDTKRLLEEHEADHANPHQVTKAQVGLGNADNTSDADKPISTATAAALAGKVDKLGSSPAGSYTKVTVNAQGQVTAGSNPATLAEAGIGDAYTKSEINTKLGDGSVTKLGTADVGSDTLPIKLVGGSPTPVADALAKDSAVVHLTGDEILSDGIKASTTSGSSSANNTKDVPPRFVVQSLGFDRTLLQGINRHYPVAGLNDKNGKTVCKIHMSTTDTVLVTYLQGIGLDETQSTLEIGRFDRNTKVWTPTLAENALDSYATMVRTVNAQTITGLKTLAVAGSDIVFLQAQSTVLDQSTTGTEGRMRFRWCDKNGTGPDNRLVEISTYRRSGGNNSLYLTQFNKVNNALTSDGLAITIETDGTAHMEGPSRAYSPVNTRDIVTLSLLDAYTPMVRTSNAQTIAGDKTFTDGLIKSGAKDSAYITVKDAFFDYPTAPNQEPFFKILNSSGELIAQLAIRQNASGTHSFRVILRNSDGTSYTTQDLVTSS